MFTCILHPHAPMDGGGCRSSEPKEAARSASGPSEPWPRQCAPVQPRIKWFEAVHVLGLDVGRVLLGKPRSSCPDGVAEGSDEYLAVAGVALSPSWNIVERLVGSAKPTEPVVPDRTHTVDFDGHEPFASQWLAVPRTGSVDHVGFHGTLPQIFPA